MRKPGLFLIAFGYCMSAHAQPTYEKLWLAVGLAPLTMNELPSHNILVNFQYSRGASVIDPQGNLVQSTHYWNSQLGGPFNIRQRSANEYYFVTQFITPDSCFAFFNQQYPAIGKMDSLGNVQEVRYYVTSIHGCENNPKDLEVANDGGVITWGRNRNFFALRTDQNGEPTWAKYFGYEIGTEPVGRAGSFQFIRELPGGDLLAGINMDTAGVVVARMNANGDFLWCKSYFRPGGMVHDCLIESDSSFIITGTTDTTTTSIFDPLPPDYHPKLFMMKLSGDGEVQWCRGYDSAPNLWYAHNASRIVQAHDGNYVVLADLGVEGYNLRYRPLLMKIDHNGDTLWTRSAGRTGYTYSTTDLLAYFDGGFVFNGVMDGSIGPWSGALYIFKTDSLGHLPCYERWHPITIEDLFPTDSSFTLSSVDGATMYEVSVSDTSYAPITVYDGCTFTTDLRPDISRSRVKPRIRPNPNTGRFTLEVRDPLMAQSYYSVYDALGKLLYQRPLPAGATVEEIDLSRFGRGTYVLKLTDPEGTRYERVVLE